MTLLNLWMFNWWYLEISTSIEFFWSTIQAGRAMPKLVAAQRQRKWLPHVHTLHNMNYITRFFLLFSFSPYISVLKTSLPAWPSLLRWRWRGWDATADSFWTAFNTIAASTYLLDHLGCHTSPSSAGTVHWSDCATQREFGEESDPRCIQLLKAHVLKR